jgi:hypothetical protein
MEPQPEKVGVLFFIGTTCSANASVRRLSLWNPSFLSWGSFFYWNDVFGYRLGSSPFFMEPQLFKLGFFFYT